MNKTVLLTGVTGHIGLPLAKRLIIEGFRVIGVSRNPVSDDELTSSSSYIHICENLDCYDGIYRLIEKLEGIEMPIDYLINNARSASHYEFKGGVQTLDSFNVDLHFSIILPYYLSLEIIKHYSLKNIINIGSQYGVVVGTPSLYDNFNESAPISYAVGKAALHHLTKELAVRLAPDTKVNCIALGGIEGKASQEFKEKYSTHLPLNRMLTISEATRPIVSILKDDFSAMTGAIINVDGGWTLS